MPLPDIRRCVYQLGEITGSVTYMDQLNRILGRFRIGR